MKRIATLCTLICLATVTITLAQPPEGKKGRPKRSFNSPKQQAQATQATDSSSDSEAAATFAASVGEQQATSPTAMSAMAAMAGQQSSSPSKTDRNNFIVNLTKGIDIGQILSPLSEMTKKAVLKDPAVQGKVQIFAAGKVAPDEALQLIYDALQLQDIAVYETTRSIQLIPASKAATMPIPVLQAHESASSFTHRSQIVQKIFKMKTIPPRNVQMALQPLVTKQGSISTDDRTGTLFVTDTVGNVQRFETVVATLDREEASQYVMKTIRLQHGQPDEIADLVMTMLSASGGISTPFGPRPSFFGSDSSSYRRRFGLGSARTLGDVTIIPDSRTASLMVIGPREKVERI
ncbi:hypothetical protein FJY63_06950, partial [Candidatus Sumerlaeota bacterium]|nr:hypothetical protein [Candidatus Sumerlaeota bacterium]